MKHSSTFTSVINARQWRNLKTKIMFRIGQKVVCIDNSGMPLHTPIKGEIYTFDGFDPSVYGFIFLREFDVPCPYGRYKGERNAFRATCFRPVDETFGTEVAEKIESEFINQPEPALV